MGPLGSADRYLAFEAIQQSNARECDFSEALAGLASTGHRDIAAFAAEPPGEGHKQRRCARLALVNEQCQAVADNKSQRRIALAHDEISDRHDGIHNGQLYAYTGAKR